MCPICGCVISPDDAEQPWIIQHMVQSHRGLVPADEILCCGCYRWYATYMDDWRADPDSPTRKLVAIGGRL